MVGARLRHLSAPARPDAARRAADLEVLRRVEGEDESEVAAYDSELSDCDDESEWSDEHSSQAWDSEDDEDSDAESDEDDASNADDSDEDEEFANTMMLANIPKAYSRTMLVGLLAQEGFARDVDFIFMPALFTSGESIGHAFLNFSEAEAATRFRKHFRGFKGWGIEGEKCYRADVSCGAPHQGLEANIQAYRNDRLMHESVPDELRPILMQGGERIPFPPPTKAIVPPRFPKRPAAAAGASAR